MNLRLDFSSKEKRKEREKERERERDLERDRKIYRERKNSREMGVVRVKKRRDEERKTIVINYD